MSFYMGTRNARRTRRSAESTAGARGASSREQNKAFVPVEVPPLPARRFAMLPCRSPFTPHGILFSFVPAPNPKQEFLEGTMYGESTFYFTALLLKNLLEILHEILENHRNRCILSHTGDWV